MRNTIISKYNNRKYRLWLLLLSAISTFPLIACSNDIESSIPDNWLTISTTPVTFDYEGGIESRDFTLTTGLDRSKLQVSLLNDGEDWLTIRIEDNKLTIVCEQSYSERNRNSELKIAYDDAHQCKIAISQKQAPSNEDKQIRIISAEADSEQPEYPIENSYDGDEKTHYNSKYGEVTYPFHVTYELSEGNTLNYIVYTPRQDSGNRYGSFDKFTVEVSTGDRPETFTQVGSYERGDGVHTPFTMKLSDGISNVRKVRFNITKAYENRVSISEMNFFENSTHKFDPATIFADATGTTLKKGVSEKQIKQIPNEYLRKLGLALLDKTYDPTYRLATYRPYQHPSVMAKANKTNKYSLRDNPTGIYAEWGKPFVVFVSKIPEGHSISLLIQNLNNGYNNYKTYELSEGYNEIKPQIGGLIYVLNHIDDNIPLLIEDADNKQKKLIEENSVQIHFAMGKVNGYFDILKNNENDWKKIIDNATYQDIDVLGRYSHITWKVDDFKTHNTQIKKVIENTDNLVYDEQAFLGLVKHNCMFNNRMHLCIDYKAVSPNASDYRTVYSAKGYENLFTDPSAWTARFWGPAHEVGHCNQTRPGVKWPGLTEVTNNLTALYVEEKLGKECRALTKGWYQSGIDLIVKHNINENTEDDQPHCIEYSTNLYYKVEEKLVPFWQLKLYFIDALGMKDFYHDLYQHYRQTPNPDTSSTTQGIIQLDFVRQVCAISGYDMTDFFKAWGFLSPTDQYVNNNGTKTKFTITQKQIDALVQEIKSAGYKQPHSDLYLIKDDNWNEFRD